MTSTIKADVLQSKTTDGDLTISGDGSGVPNLEAGFKVGGTAGVPVSALRAGTDGELITWNASGVASTVPVGTATHILTSNGVGAAPTFQAAGGGGAWSVITTVDVTAVSSIEFTGFDASTYSHYQFWLQDIAIDVNSNLRMRTSSDGGSSYDSGASDYSWNHARVRGASEDRGWDDTDENIEVAGDGNMQDWDADNNSFFSAVLNVFSPEDTRYTSFTWVAGWIGGGGDLNAGHFSGTRKSTADVDAIQFYPNGGAFKALGTIKMLGMAN